MYCIVMLNKSHFCPKKKKKMNASGNLSCDQSGCFCRPMLHVVYLSLYLDSSKWACSMLEGWKISASSHLLCSPSSSEVNATLYLFLYMYTVKQVELNCSAMIVKCTYFYVRRLKYSFWVKVLLNARINSCYQFILL